MEFGRLLKLIVIALAVVLPVRAWVAEPIYVASPSMEPTLKTGESFEYTSGVPLPTPSGFMTGSYGMVTMAGEHFDIEVPKQEFGDFHSGPFQNRCGKRNDDGRKIASGQPCFREG